ncbi:MAG: ATP-binding protein, partial [Lachnospiraceae bacterium]|nr:ATP-binding protein [Lachnospiraceae bacterium]
MDIKKLIGEATEYDKKLVLEEKKPKSWCKSVSAFANTFGGALLYGVSNEGAVVGL